MPPRKRVALRWEKLLLGLSLLALPAASGPQSAPRLFEVKIAYSADIVGLRQEMTAIRDQTARWVRIAPSSKHLEHESQLRPLWVGRFVNYAALLTKDPDGDYDVYLNPEFPLGKDNPRLSVRRSNSRSLAATVTVLALENHARAAATNVRRFGELVGLCGARDMVIGSHRVTVPAIARTSPCIRADVRQAVRARRAA